MPAHNKNKQFVVLFLINIIIITASCSQNKDLTKDTPSLTQTKISFISNNLTKPDQANESGQTNQNNLGCNTTLKSATTATGLLSPRVYAGLLEPQSFLITNFEPLRIGIRNYLNENNISASIYIENLRNGVNVGINQNRGYFPASLNKLPVAVLILQKIEDGKLTFGTLLPIRDNERSSASGTLYSSNATWLSTKELLEKMLKESDNTAFQVLYDNIDKDELKELLDYYNIKINVDYPDRRLEFANHTDQVTPISMYNLFSSLYLSTVLEPADSEYLLSLLANSDFDIKNIAGLPANVTISQKYGEYYEDDTKQFHDCGIIYIGQSRIFYCIMTRNLYAEDARQSIGFIVNHIYNYVIYTRSELDIKKMNSRKSG